MSASEIWMTLKIDQQFLNSFLKSNFQILKSVLIKNVTYTFNPYFAYKTSSKITKEVTTTFNDLVLALCLLTLKNFSKRPKRWLPVTFLRGHYFQKIRSNHNNNGSTQPRCSMKKGVLRNFTKFTEKHLCQGLFFNKVAGLRSPTLFKGRLWHRCFPVNFAKFLRTPF